MVGDPCVIGHTLSFLSDYGPHIKQASERRDLRFLRKESFFAQASKASKETGWQVPSFVNQERRPWRIDWSGSLACPFYEAKAIDTSGVRL